MVIKANLLKDVGRVETFLKTDIASLGLWNSNGMSWVDSPEVFSKEFNLLFSAGQPKVENNLIGIDTGSDGNFKVIINLNNDLSDQDRQSLYKSETGILLEVDGAIRIGSLEWVGYAEKSAVEDNRIESLELPPGKYIIDAYSLLSKDPSGQPKFISFALSIFTEEKYKKLNKKIRSNNAILRLKYSP